MAKFNDPIKVVVVEKAGEQDLLDDSFIYGDYYSDVCTNCNNLIDEINHTCKAYNTPKNIPNKIWSGEDNHKKPFKGDRGIQFIPVTEETLNNRIATADAIVKGL